jgi:hypothetical protein
MLTILKIDSRRCFETRKSRTTRNARNGRFLFVCFFLIRPFRVSPICRCFRNRLSTDLRRHRAARAGRRVGNARRQYLTDTGARHRCRPMPIPAAVGHKDGPDGRGAKTLPINAFSCLIVPPRGRVCCNGPIPMAPCRLLAAGRQNSIRARVCCPPGFDRHAAQ